MRTIELHTADGVIVRVPGVGVVDCYATAGVSIPADGTSGYAPGCTCRDTVNGALYVNEGTADSCDFDLVTVA